MPRTCYYCGKGPSFGKSIARRGLAKKKGGVGRKITGISVRKFRPNLQRVKAMVSGATKTIYACAKCIKQGSVIKPLRPAPAVVQSAS